MPGSLISLPAVRRMPHYLRLCKAARARGRDVISCRRISEDLGVDPTLVRKDLEHTGVTGKPRVGYVIEELIPAIAAFLGWNNKTEAVLAGAGNMGQALMGYEGFKDYGFNIVAAFDKSPEKIGKQVNGIYILDIEKMADLVERMHIRIGVLAVPAPAAQEVCTAMVLSGLQAIWNFTPVTLDVPPSLVLENVNLVSSLAVLSNKLVTATATNEVKNKEIADSIG